MVSFTRTVSPLCALVIGREGSATVVSSCEIAHARVTAATAGGGVV